MNLRLVWAAILAAGLSGTSFADDFGISIRANGRSVARSYFSPNTIPLKGVFFRIGPTDPVGSSFDTILFQGEMPVDGVVFEISRDAGGTWSPWKGAYIKRYSNGRFWAKFEFNSASSGRIKIRAINAGNRSRGRVEIYSMEAILRSAASVEESGGSTAGKTVPKDAPSAAKPPVVSRDGWGANPPDGEWEPHAVFRFTQHHTQGRRPLGLEDSKRELLIIQDFHQNGRGWKDIGYHFLIDAEGRIFQGRPEGAIGAHTRGENSGNIGIAFLGNHHPPKNHAVTAAQKESLKRLGKWLIEQYGIDVAAYKGHRDYNPTHCPGDVVYGQLETIRKSFTTPRLPPGGDLKVERFAPHDPKGALIPVGGS